MFLTPNQKKEDNFLHKIENAFFKSHTIGNEIARIVLNDKKIIASQSAYWLLLAGC